MGAAACGGRSLEESVPEGLHPVVRTMLEWFLKNRIVLEAHIGSVWERLHPMTNIPSHSFRCQWLSLHRLSPHFFHGSSKDGR